MAESKKGRFACPSCGRSFTWKRELAGKKVRCKCKAAIRVPEALPADDGTYELDRTAVRDAELAAQVKREGKVPTTSKKSEGAAGRCPSCGAAVSKQAVICIQCGFDRSSGKQIQTTVDGDPQGGSDTATPASGAGNGLFGRIKRVLRPGQQPKNGPPGA